MGHSVLVGRAVAVGTEVDVDGLVDAAVGVDKGGAWSELQASDTKIKLTTANQKESNGIRTWNWLPGKRTPSWLGLST